jgi:hypothetical protein
MLHRVRLCWSVVLVLPMLMACAVERQPVEPALADLVQDGSVAVAVLADTVSAGGVTSVQFGNRSDHTYGFHPCERVVQRRGSNGWSTHREPQRVCTAMLYMLDADSERTERVDVPRDIAPGEYRLVFRFNALSGSQGAVRAASGVFWVR